MKTMMKMSERRRNVRADTNNEGREAKEDSDGRNCKRVTGTVAFCCFVTCDLIDETRHKNSLYALRSRPELQRRELKRFKMSHICSKGRHCEHQGNEFHQVRMAGMRKSTKKKALKESVRRPSTTPGKVGSFHGGGYALQDGNKEKFKVVGGRCKRDSKSCQRGIWVKSRARKTLILWKHKERKNDHFATRMDICHLKTRC